MEITELEQDRTSQQYASLAVHDVYVKGFRAGARAMKQRCGNAALGVVEPVSKELAASVGRAILETRVKDPESMLFDRADV